MKRKKQITKIITRKSYAPPFVYKTFVKFRASLANNSGFTLIEMLIATAISSIILLMIYSAHRSISFAINELTGIADFYENINLTINRIDRDISCSLFSRDNKKLCFIGESDIDSIGLGKLNFVTVDHKKKSILADPSWEYPISDVKELGYYLKEDEEIDGVFLLMRREENHYDDDPETGGEENLLLENVVDIQFEFKERNTWTRRWDSTDHHKFPMAVRTTLKVKNYRGNDEEFVFISYINITK
ncbi:MAG: type II secretion system protein GspJ [Spirochaetota bacterium]|nr:type II secretion system protein GspJ [Spirochaetota bacterium]